MGFELSSLGHTEKNASAETLALHQMRLRDKKFTALIEAALEPGTRILIPFAHGVLTGMYCTNNEGCHPLSNAELDELCQQGIKQISVVPLHDTLGRLAWLACESTRRGSEQGANAEAWNQHLRNWKMEGWTGLVEITSDTARGFMYMRRGEPVQFEAAMVSVTGESLEDFTAINAASPWKAERFDLDPGGKAAQCLVLRQALAHWTGSIFDSYKNIAGEKFILVMVRELQAQVRPWSWNIRVEPHVVVDSHFFAGAEATAHAYRAILMGIGAQMGFAIGGYLTQRILTEMFNELENEERSSLETYRLIPAAFS